MSEVDNTVYDRLGERWYEADDDPIALLRAESRLRNPWLAEVIRRARHDAPAKILDVGCGGGFLANELATLPDGHEVTGLDASAESLEIARRHDRTGRVHYIDGDATHLPFADGSFDVVCAMDFLEHVVDPAQIVREAARVLAPGGHFFFHTFDRNWLSWLVVIKGVELFVKNTPKDLHVLHRFVKPRELRAMCQDAGLTVAELHGSGPVVWSKPFWRMVTTGRVGQDFRFAFTGVPWLGYTGYARRG